MAVAHTGFLKLRELLRSRKFAYQQVFNPENQFTGKVLKDLARFCRAHDSTFLPDSRAHAVLEGRREVFLRIAHHLQLDDEAIWKLYGGNND